MKVLIIFLLVLLISCSDKVNRQKQDLHSFTKSEISVIDRFSDSLTVSLRNHKYDLIKSTWSHDAFKQRVHQQIEEGLNVFNILFDTDLKGMIDYDNVDLVNKQKYEEGELLPLKTKIFDNHAEITYLLIFGGSYRLWRYRVELSDGKPILNDYFLFTEDIWQSQNMENIMRVNNRYLAGSKKRTEANLGMINYRKTLKSGDTIAAFHHLYSIPETHQIGNGVSLAKIYCACAISDSLFYKVLLQESELRNSPYIDYLNAFYTNDSARLESIHDRMSQKYGINEKLIEAIRASNLKWER